MHHDVEKSLSVKDRPISVYLDTDTKNSIESLNTRISGLRVGDMSENISRYDILNDIFLQYTIYRSASNTTHFLRRFKIVFITII